VWAIGHVGGSKARSMLQRAELDESDESVRAEIDLALSGSQRSSRSAM
jgi:hypothetical protein